MHEKEVAWILLNKKAVLLNPDEPFTYASGIRSPIYCDNRLLISFPKEREQIVDFFVDMIEKNKLDAEVIAGTATAAIPWAAFVAQKLGKPMVYVKKKAKGHGTMKLVEGSLQKGQKVILIEDLISTGGSSLAAIEAIQKAGGEIDTCLAIFSYQMKKAEQNFKEKKLKAITLSNFTALVDVAAQNNYIKGGKKEIILEWNKDPENWKS